MTKQTASPKFEYEKSLQGTAAGSMLIGFKMELMDPQEFGFQKLLGHAKISQKGEIAAQNRQSAVNEFQYSWTVEGHFNGKGGQVMQFGDGGEHRVRLDTQGEKYRRDGHAGTAREAAQEMEQAALELIEKRPDLLLGQLQIRLGNINQDLIEFLQETAPSLPQPGA